MARSAKKEAGQQLEVLRERWPLAFPAQAQDVTMKLRWSFADLVEPVCLRHSQLAEAATSRQISRRTTAMNLALRCLYIALAVVLPEAGAWATVYEVAARPNLEFAHTMARVWRAISICQRGWKSPQ